MSTNSTKREDLNMKTNLTNLFKWFLNLVRDQEALTGDKALRTLAYILILRLSEPQIDNGMIDIKTISFYDTIEGSDEAKLEITKYIKFSNLAKLKEDNINKIIGDLLNMLPCHPNFSKFFKENENPFRIKHPSTYFKIIKRFNEFEFEKYDVDIQGEAYEEVIKDIMVGKVLGQFFTPPFVKQLVVDLVDPKIMDDGKIETIYDPAMGTGGFLITCLRHMAKQSVEKNIKLDWDFVTKEGLGGREIEQDTHKLCEANMLISSGYNFETLECGDSIRIPKKKKYDVIVANPPFGIKGLKYNDIHPGMNKYDYIPIQSNSAVPLFLQLIIYLLKINGRCGIVVPNGQDLFNKNSALIALREYIVKTCDLKEIIHIPSGVFNSTDIKTCIFYFVKKKEGNDVVTVCEKKKQNGYNFVDGFSTEVIKFYDYDCEKKEKKLLVEVGINDIAKNDYSLNYMDYVKKDEVVYGEDVKVMRLGDVCIFKNGKSLKRENIIKGNYPVIGGGKQPSCYNNNYNRIENTILCSSSGAYAGYISKYPSKVWASDCFSINTKDINMLLESYLYYYLKNIQENIYKLQIGLAQPHIYSSTIGKLEIPIPPLQLQQEIIKKLEHNDNIIQSLQKEIEHLKELSKRIITNITTPKLQEKKPALLKNIVESIEYGKNNLHKDEYNKIETDNFKIPYYSSSGMQFCEKNTKEGTYLLINRNPKSSNNFIKVDGKFNISKMMIIIKLQDKYINQIDNILEQLNKYNFADIVKNNPVTKSSKVSDKIEVEHFDDIYITL
jgi:type I restriction-modification system DNA methylase subunit